MPPKGWRKGADGTYPLGQGVESVSIDELLFPRTTIQKLAKLILNQDEDDNLILAKDSLLALQRSATVFVSNLLFHATQVMKDKSRKTVNAQDILEALEKADFHGFLPEVKQQLSVFEQKRESKKKQKQLEREKSGVPATKKRKDNNAGSNDADDDDDELDDEDDDEDDTIKEEEEVDDNDIMEDDEDDEDDDVKKSGLQVLDDEQKELEGEDEDDEDDNEEDEDVDEDDDK